jgi:hypothetical protein
MAVFLRDETCCQKMRNITENTFQCTTYLEVVLHYILDIYTHNLLFSITTSRSISKRSLLKGKSIPLQAWRYPEGPRKLRPPDFKTISI